MQFIPVMIFYHELVDPHDISVSKLFVDLLHVPVIKQYFYPSKLILTQIRVKDFYVGVAGEKHINTCF